MVVTLSEKQQHRVFILNQILGSEIEVQNFEIQDEDPYKIYETALNKDLDSIDIEDERNKVNLFTSKLDDSKGILDPIKKYFEDFETNLKQVTNEMESLQTRLSELNQVLKEKEQIEQTLTPILEKILISSKTINTLQNGEIDLEWITQLNELETKSDELIKYKESGNTTVNSETIEQLTNVIENLENKCIEKIRNLMITKIKSLRLVGSIPREVQAELLPMASVMELLKKRIPSLANEFKSAYIYTVRWNYYYHIIKYTMGLENAKLVDIMDTSINFDSNSINEYLINLPRRIDQLNENDDELNSNIPMMDSISNIKVNIEQLVQYLNSFILDNFINETNFLLKFFGLNNEELNQALKLEFTPIFKIGDGFTNWITNDNIFDYFGILLIIRRFQRMEYKAQNEMVPELINNYFNKQLLELWPRFQRNIDILCQNMSKSFGSSSLIREIVSSKTLLIPLRLTQTFSTILVHLIKLSQNLAFEIETTEPLENSIQRISINFERGVVQLSKSLNDDKQKLFLYVNFQLVYNVLDGEIERENKEDDEERKIGNTILNHYKQLMDVYK